MELKQALQIVVDHLDNMMGTQPSRELADVSNYLQALLEQEQANA